MPKKQKNQAYTPLFILLIFFIATSIASATIGLNHPLFLLDENQVMYLFSTSAQVVAGIFGLTITGYIFLRNELDRRKSDDESLSDAVETLKSQSFDFLAFLTLFSTAAIFACLFAICFWLPESGRSFVVTLNVSQSLLATTLLAIAYFVFDILSPDKIKKISDTIRTELEGQVDDDKGSLEEFLRNYNSIERLLDGYQETHFQQYKAPSSRVNNFRISKSKIVDFLMQNEVIDMDTRDQLIGLIRLRNSLIHGSEPIVSQHMVLEAARLKEMLTNAIAANDPGTAPPIYDVGLV